MVWGSARAALAAECPPLPPRDPHFPPLLAAPRWPNSPGTHGRTGTSSTKHPKLREGTPSGLSKEPNSPQILRLTFWEALGGRAEPWRGRWLDLCLCLAAEESRKAKNPPVAMGTPGFTNQARSYLCLRRSHLLIKSSARVPRSPPAQRQPQIPRRSPEIASDSGCLRAQLSPSTIPNCCD